MPPKFQRQTAKVLSGPQDRPVIDETDRLHGLSADFPRLIEVDLDRIRVNPEQPRTVFDEDALQALAQSIAAHGLQQPILIKEEAEKGRYLLVAGERRWRAHQILGRKTIYAIITTGRPEEIALIENVQRVDLDAVDLARGLARLIDQHGYTQEAVGALIGCERAEVNRRLAVLRLPEEILTDYRQRATEISRSLLVEIATVEGRDRQRALWVKAREGVTVQALRAEKKAQQAPATDRTALGLRTLGQSLLRMDKDVARMVEHRDLLATDHKDRLRALRDQIDALLNDA